MEPIEIHKFEARYHLPPSLLYRREKLDAVLAQVLDQGLSLAMAKNGVPARQEICIRKLVMPVRLATSLSESSLVAVWSEALADYLRQAAHSGNSQNVICYASRLEALVDFAQCLSRGDFTLHWAWRQLGFWSGSTPASIPEGIASLAAVLCEQGRRIVPWMMTLARRGALAELATLFTSQQWAALAVSALAAHGVPDPETLLAKAQQSLPTLPAGGRLDDITRRVASRSRLAASLAQAAGLNATAGLAAPVSAVFVVLETEPDLLRRTDLPTPILLGQIAAVGRLAPTDGTGPIPGAALRPGPQAPPRKQTWPSDSSPLPVPVEQPAAESAPERVRQMAAEEPRHPRRQNEARNAVPTTRSVSDSARTRSGYPHDSAAVGPSHRGTMTGNGERSTTTDPVLGTERSLARETISAPTDLFSIGYTKVGGLLFLTPLLAPLGIIDQFHSSAEFGNRSLRWALHRLALRLHPVDERDPGVLAFCGLQPSDEPPDRLAPGPSRAEQQMLTQWKADLVTALSEKLGWQHMSAPKLLHSVCARRARIEAEPGWFTIFFSLEDVRTDIRTAALDLDPGFLPWLGVVITYVYE